MSEYQMGLFGDPPEPAPVYKPLPKKNRVDTGRTGWELVDHACRLCLGRIVVRRQRGVTVEARCCECGQHAFGDIADVCCCGADCGTAGRVLECFRNPDITPSVPQEVLVRERVVVERRGERRQAKPVGSKDF